MISLSPRLIGVAAVVAVVGWLGYVIYDRAQLQDDLRKVSANLVTANATIADQIRNKQLEDWARDQYLQKLEQAENENDRYEKCIANKTCVATIRVLDPNRVPAADGTGGVKEISAQLSPDSARTRARLERNIKLTESKLAFCIQTLNDWASPQAK